MEPGRGREAAVAPAEVGAKLRPVVGRIVSASQPLADLQLQRPGVGNLPIHAPNGLQLPFLAFDRPAKIRRQQQPQRLDAVAEARDAPQGPPPFGSIFPAEGQAGLIGYLRAGSQRTSERGGEIRRIIPTGDSPPYPLPSGKSHTANRRHSPWKYVQGHFSEHFRPAEAIKTIRRDEQLTILRL